MFSNEVETGRVKDEDGKDVNTKRREDKESERGKYDKIPWEY